jgi:hypothetical protein
MTTTGKRQTQFLGTICAASTALLCLPSFAQAQSAASTGQNTSAQKSTSGAADTQSGTNGILPAPPSKPSSWHFQTTYGVSSADLEAPYWNTALDPVAAAQRSTTGALTQVRYSHSIESALNNSQALRWGFALVNEQTVAKNSWAAALAKESKAPEWRAWGIGTDIFLVRHLSPAVDFDAGLQADYFISGVATLGTSDTAAAAQSAAQNRLEQKSGWRIAFTGGIGGLYMGPLGLIARISGYVMQSSFKTHSQPLRAQGLQLQLGMDLALGRGDP